MMTRGSSLMDPRNMPPIQSIKARKQAYRDFKQQLCDELAKQANIVSITQQLVRYTDELLLALCKEHQIIGTSVSSPFCLVALGSYGRRELQLYSDIDLLILHQQPLSETEIARVQALIQSCWDVGLAVGHQLSPVAACADLAATDLTVISTLMDQRYLCGNRDLLEELIYQISPLHMWNSHDYFLAKQQEQQQRHSKYDNTAYNLEPNVKNGPGGLRDLQILLSIAKRQFHIQHLAEGIQHGFMTDREYEEFIACQHFLWRVRFALHILADKAEDRLLFDYQVKLAAFFGYQDNAKALAIEQFMKAYFQVIKRTRELNEMLLQWFAEVILFNQKQRLFPLDDYFQRCNNTIEVRHQRVFKQHPRALLQLFVWISQMPEIQGVRANTIRLIRESLYLINASFRRSKQNARLFIQLFQSPTPYFALHCMNRYGVLARYLDSFAAVTGQMQYDLFHVYTVDQHTLFVIRNMERFHLGDPGGAFKLATQVFNQLAKPEIAYLSGLFHDIAKGRGGDHAELGAQDAEEFARHHGLDQADTDLLVWLVRYHLLMSTTAQRQDIYDPKTIAHFSQQLPAPHYLDYLYILTVADICATNPGLWNSWKDSLLKELYRASHSYLQKEQALLDEAELIEDKQRIALHRLTKAGQDPQAIQALWAHFRNRYFLHQTPDVIARHTLAILKAEDYPLILIHPHHSDGGTEVFMYMPHQDTRFIIATTVLSNQHLSIHEAMITTCNNQYDMDSYVVLDEHNQAQLSVERAEQISLALRKALSSPQKIPLISKKRLSRAQAHFQIKPRIQFSRDQDSPYTALFLVASDRPGLLATISKVFSEHRLHLHGAKIVTAGERVEDMFNLTNAQSLPLDNEEMQSLAAALEAVLAGSRT